MQVTMEATTPEGPAVLSLRLHDAEGAFLQINVHKDHQTTQNDLQRRRQKRNLVKMIDALARLGMAEDENRTLKRGTLRAEKPDH